MSNTEQVLAELGLNHETTQGEVQPQAVNDGLETIAGGELENQPTQTPESAPSNETQQITPPDDAAKKAETEAFYQTKYQNLLGQLKTKLDAATYASLTGKSATQTQHTESHTNQQQQNQPAYDLANTSLADIPAEYAMRIIEERMAQKVQNNLQAQRLTDQLAQERYDVATMVYGWARENGFSDADVQRIDQEVVAMGIPTNTPGGPTQHAQLVVRLLNAERVANAIQQTSVQATARATQQVKQQLLASQPAAGAAPGQKTLTKEEKLLADIQGAGQGKRISDMLK